MAWRGRDREELGGPAPSLGGARRAWQSRGGASERADAQRREDCGELKAACCAWEGHGARRRGARLVAAVAVAAAVQLGVPR